MDEDGLEELEKAHGENPWAPNMTKEEEFVDFHRHTFKEVKVK